MFGSMEAETLTAETHFADPGFQGLVQLIRSAVGEGQLDAPHYTAEQLAYHIWFISHGIAMLRITLFRDAPEFAIISDDVIQAFAKSIIKE